MFLIKVASFIPDSEEIILDMAIHYVFFHIYEVFILCRSFIINHEFCGKFCLSKNAVVLKIWFLAKRHPFLRLVTPKIYSYSYQSRNQFWSFKFCEICTLGGVFFHVWLIWEPELKKLSVAEQCPVQSSDKVFRVLIQIVNIQCDFLRKMIGTRNLIFGQVGYFGQTQRVQNVLVYSCFDLISVLFKSLKDD